MSITKKEVAKVWVDNSAVFVELKDGRIKKELFKDFERLKYAKKSQREKFTLDHFGIRWESIDEDLSFDGFFQEKPKAGVVGTVLRKHPELKAVAIGKRLGISQTLFAQYVIGTKKPSAKREKEILDEIRKIGRELASV